MQKSLNDQGKSECKYNLYLKWKRRTFMNFYEKPAKNIFPRTNRRDKYYDLWDKEKENIMIYERKNKFKIEWIVLSGH
jgi:hypothetical protein